MICGNDVKNIKFGLKIPATNGFYLPNIDSDEHLIDLDSGTHVNNIFAASWRYKKNDGTQVSHLKYAPNVGNDFTPENLDVHPIVIVKNENGLTIVD